MISSPEPRVRLKNLEISLPEWGDRKSAVNNVSFDLMENEIVCIVGESGSGKSVLSKAIMKLLPDYMKLAGGNIILGGDDITNASPEKMRKIRGARIGMIFQDPMSALNPLIKVGSQIMEVLEIHGNFLLKNENRNKVLEMLDLVRLPDPEKIYDAFPHQLSGGQRQRVMIAMALILDPEVLIADEPTTALDVTSQAQILSLIKSLQKRKKTSVLFVTHDFGVVAEIADRIVVMKSGEMVEQGRAEEILKTPKHHYTKTLINSVPKLEFKDSLERDRKLNTVLLVRTLNKKFQGKKSLIGANGRDVIAVKDANISLQSGKTLGVVGESGSGKSTLAKCVAQLITPDSGEVFLNEKNLLKLKRDELRIARKEMQVVFQDPFSSLNPRETVLEIVSKGPIIHGASRHEAEKTARELLETVGLSQQAANRYPHEFSGGQRQRVGIARALALKPTLLIADEPVSALDVTVQAQVLKLLADVREKYNLAMLFITHDLRVAAQVCDDIIVMKRGEIVEHGTTKFVFTNPQHSYTRELLSAIPGSWL